MICIQSKNILTDLKIGGFNKAIFLHAQLHVSYIRCVLGIQNEWIKRETFLGGIMVTLF